MKSTSPGYVERRTLQAVASLSLSSLPPSLPPFLPPPSLPLPLSQAVVLSLCLAVQRKPNEDVISHITTLHYKAQCDIMFFIEEALAKMNSNALSSRLFTSGERDSLAVRSSLTTQTFFESVMF